MLGHRTMMWATESDIHISVQTAVTVTDQEWDDYCTDLHKKVAEKRVTRIFVLTDPGSNLTPAQRQKLSRLPGVGAVPAAIVTDSSLTRGILTALNWLGKVTKPFPPTRLEEALDYLEVPRAKQAVVLWRTAILRISLATEAHPEAVQGKINAADNPSTLEALTAPLQSVRLRYSAS